jgi:hypothetical protein
MHPGAGGAAGYIHCDAQVDDATSTAMAVENFHGGVSAEPDAESGY